MEREVSDRNILDRFCLDFCGVVDKHCRYIVVSGFVAISSGRTRGTEDIDIIIENLPLARFSRLHADLVKNGFTCMQGADAKGVYSYLSDKTSVRYTYRDRFLPEMELKLSKDPLDEYQLQTRKKIPLTGLDVWFSSINMNISFKEELLKSDKDMEDARHLRKVFNEEVDEHEISEIKKMIRRYRL